MSRKDDIREIKELTLKLNNWCYEYYVLSKPSVSDKTFDDNFDRLKKLEEATGFYFSGSPTKNVGFRVNSELPKITHSYPLLSLDKTKDRMVAMNYTNGYDALLMHKLDGLTICLEYNNGQLITAATRGNGEVGNIITDNAKTFVNVPLTIEYKGYLKITGEGIIHIDDFNMINSQIKDDKDKFKTPRNLASGSVQQLNSAICSQRRVHFYAFNVVEGLDEIKSLNERLKKIAEFGFDICQYILFNSQKTNYTSFNELIDNLVESAKINNIPIDGLVVTYDDIPYAKTLGRTQKFYRSGIAYKFKEEEEESVLRDIEWQVGRTGKVTPVAVFDTVVLDGTDINRASLHNLSIMEELKIKKNSQVVIVKKNEIIPQIISASGGDEYFEIPGVCPVCKGKLTVISENNSSTLYCLNNECAVKNIKKIAYFASKECMNIDGLSEKTIEKLFHAGIVRNLLDIYKLENHHDEIVKFEGMGEKSYKKLLLSIEKSKAVKLENFIAGIGIMNFALSKAKVISKNFNGDWKLFKAAVDSRFDFAKLELIGRDTNKCIYMFFDKTYKKNEDMYTELISLMEFVKESAKPDYFVGKTYVITGSLNIFGNRKELQNKIESLGGKVATSVSKKTTCLINNDRNSSSSKNRDAMKFGIPIITEEMFLKELEIDE